MKRQRFLIFTFAFVLITSLLAGQLLHMPPVAAYSPHSGNAPPMSDANAKAGTFRWVNRAIIKGTFPSDAGTVTLTFKDQGIGDTNYEYRVQNYACDGRINVHPKKDKDKFGNLQLDPTKGDLDLDVIHPNINNADCSNIGGKDNPTITNAPIQDTQNANYYLQQTDANTIQLVDGSKNSNDPFGPAEFSNTNSQDPKQYLMVGNKDVCPAMVIVSGSANNLQVKIISLPTEQEQRGYPKYSPSEIHTATTCWDSFHTGEPGLVGGAPDNVLLPLLTDKSKFTDGVIAPVSASGSDTNCSPGTVACNNALCEANGLSLSWFICPVVNGIADAADTIFDNVAKPLLQSGSINFTQPNDDSYKVYQVWSNFRIIGNVLLILALIVIVFGQSIGGGIVDSYTAKKIAPRLLIAAVMINLSIYIVALLVDITNIVGGGIYGLIVAPAAASGGLKFSIGAGAGGFGLVTLVGLGMAVLTQIGRSFIPFLLLAVVLPALLAMLGVIATLILRRAIILLLVIVSPVAFALYCLPNTEKLFRQWWNLLFKTLMVYPITMAIVGAVNLLASIIGTANSSSGVPQFFANLTAMILIVLPLFIIPFAFKMSGGLVGGIYNGINGATAGVRKGLRGAGVRHAGGEIKKYRAGGALDDNHGANKWKRRGNTIGSYIFNADEKLPYVLGKRGTEGKLTIPGFKGAYMRLESKVDAAREHQSKELAQTINEGGGNDQTGRVLSGAINSGMSRETRRKLIDRLGVVNERGEKEFTGLHSAEDYDKAIEIMGESQIVGERHAAGALRNLKGTMLNLKREGKGYADVSAAGALIVASHGFATEQDVVDIGNMAEKAHGKAYADTLMTQMEINGGKSGLKVTYSHSRDEDDNIITGEQAGRGWDRATSKSYAEIAQQKNHAVKSDVKQLREIIEFADMDDNAKQQQIQLWQTDHNEYLRDEKGEIVRDKITQQPIVRHVKALTQDAINSRLENIEQKGAIATQQLQTIASNYNPGAGDAGTVAKGALDSLEEQRNNGGPKIPPPPPSAVQPPPPAAGPQGGVGGAAPIAGGGMDIPPSL